MFKLVFLFVVLVVAVAVTAAAPRPHPRQNQSKKVSAAQKHSVHHGVNLHGHVAKRVARSHAVHAPVHRGPAGSGHHPNKVGGGAHGIRGGNNHGVHGGNKGGAHPPVKHRGHRK